MFRNIENIPIFIREGSFTDKENFIFRAMGHAVIFRDMQIHFLYIPGTVPSLTGKAVIIRDI